MAAEQREMTARQRGRVDRSGKAASSVIYGKGDSAPEPQPVRQLTKNPVKDNYRSASEFYAGPSQPGKIHGMRRNEAAEQDSVAFLLTDEGLMTRAPGGGAGRGGRPGAGAGGAGVTGYGGYGGSTGNKVPKVPMAERDNVDHACYPVAPEPAWRSGVRITHPGAGMDAPYFEDLDPKPAREMPAVTGKRHVRPVQHKQNMFIDPSKPLTAEEKLALMGPPRKSNKSNESVNVLCLNMYTPEQLHEPRPTYRPLGPRKWTAPDMPPKPKPYFAPVKTRAKDEHDVLGTGRWGTPEVPRPEGVGRGACRPKHDTANLFAGDQRQRMRRSWVPPSEVRKPTAMQRKYAGQPNLLKYYDPNVDGPMTQPKPKPHGNRTNEETKEDMGPFRPSRAPGVYAKNSKGTCESLW